MIYLSILAHFAIVGSVQPYQVGFAFTITNGLFGLVIKTIQLAKTLEED